MRNVSYYKATREDAIRFYDSVKGAGAHCAMGEDWIGVCAKSGSLIVGFGGITRIESGVGFGFIDAIQGAKRPIMFRLAKRLIAEAQSKGMKTIISSCNNKIDNADLFLRRLGFIETDIVTDIGERIWSCRA